MKLQRVNISSKILVRVCALVMMVIAYSGCGTDPPPPPPPDNPWEPCQCDAPMYEIIVPSHAERITITPDKPLYGKGELVSITYEPLGDELFTYWRVFPYSHLGSESESSTIYIYMTDHTSIVPNWKPRFVSVTARTNISYGGSVYREPDMGLYEYGTEVTLTAIPAPGYRLKRWASDTGALMNNGYRYESTITVKATAGYIYTAEFEPTTIPPPPLPTYMGEVIVTGGTADIFTASDDSSVKPASYYHDSCGVYWRFLARCDIDPGYDFVYWRCVPPLTGIPKYYVYNEPQLNMELNAFGSAGDTITFEAYLTKTVDLDIEIQGQGVVTSPNFRSHYNPQMYITSEYPYTDANLPPRIDSNRVEMTADPCPGWEFHHWEIKDVNKQWMPVTVPHPTTGVPLNVTGPINVYMNWWQPVPNGGPTNQENLRHVPPGEETHYVRAVFSNNKKALCVESHDSWFVGPSASTSLANNGYTVTQLNQPPSTEVYNEVTYNNIFSFWGHGTEGGAIIVQDNWFAEDEIVSWQGVSINNGSNHYSLVVLSCCYAGGEKKWKDGFNADSFIGWSTPVSFGRLEDWEVKFWNYVFSGHYTASAAIQAFMDTEYSFFSLDYWIHDPEKIECYGSILLPQCGS